MLHYLGVIVLIILSLSRLSQSADFHVSKTIRVSGSRNVNNVVGLGAKSMAVIEGGLSNCTITVLGGNSYDTQLFKSQEDGLVSQPKFEGQSTVVVNKGYFLYLKNYAKFTQYPNLNISGNIVTGKQKTIFSQSRQCPTLTTFTSSYRDIRSKTYGAQGQCLSYAAGYVSQYSDRYLLYAVKHTIMMLDRYNDLNMFQSYTHSAEYQLPEYEYSWVQSYYNNSTNQLTVLARYSNSNRHNYEILHSINAGTFSSSPFALYNPTSSLYLTGLNSGVSFVDDYLYRWQKLDGLTLSLDYKTTSQSLKGTHPTCVSYDETVFIQHINNKIFIYSLPADGYEITKINELVIADVDYVVDGRITKDNKFYILNVVKGAKYGTFCRVNSTDLQVQCFNEKRLSSSQPELMNVYADQKMEFKQKNSHLNRRRNKDLIKVSVSSQGYLSMSKSQAQHRPEGKSPGEDGHFYDCPLWAIYSDWDLFVAACLNETSKLAELHLYKISTMELVTAQKIYLGDIPPPVEAKLIRNEYKQQNDPSISDRPLFLLVLKISQTYDDAVTIRYIVEGRSSFIRQNPPSYDISFENVYAYGNYIASMKLKNGTTQTNALSFFDFTSLKVVKQVPFEYAAFSGYHHLNGYRNILMVVEDFGIRGVHFYDLRKHPNENNWFRGIFYNEYFRNQLIDPTFGQFIIFPKRNLQYFYQYQQTDTLKNQPLKQIIDISVGPVEQKVRMHYEPIQRVDIYAYLKPLITVVSRECEIVFYVTDGRWLHKYEDCEEQKQSTMIDLNPANKTGSFQFKLLTESDAKDNIVITYNHTVNNHKYDIIEVRSIGQPQRIIWSSNKTATIQPLQFVNYIETIYGTSAVQGYRTKLNYRDIEQVLNSSYYELLSIDQVDLASQCTTFGGKSQQSGGLDTFVYYSRANFVQNLHKTRQTPIRNLGISGVLIKNDTVKSLLIASDCSKLAALTNKGSVLVWNITTQPELIKNSTKQNYVDIQFSGSSKIVVKTTTGAEIINLDPALNQKDINVDGVNAYISKIAASKDGSYYAVTTGPLAVKINTILDQQIRTFKVPIDATTQNQFIISLSFSQQDNLLVGLSNSIVYVLSPSPCPDPFINDNGVCICQANQTLVSDNCECKNHFSPQGNTCVCDLQQFVYQNGQCLCSANSSQVQGKCTCHDNFVKTGAQCTCPPSFQYDSAKLICTCPYGYVDKQECIGCSFPCETCSGSSSSCNSYRATFYILVIGAAVVVLGIIIAVVVCLRKKKKIDQNSELLKEQLIKD